jgi:hypothetical protein
MGRGRTAGEDGQEEKENQMSKDEGGRNSSFSEKPVRSHPRRLVDWINPTGSQEGPFIDRSGCTTARPGRLTRLNRSLLWHLGSLSLRESRVRETCMHGLRGGRWPALGKPDAPPPTRVRLRGGAIVTYHQRSLARESWRPIRGCS